MFCLCLLRDICFVNYFGFNTDGFVECISELFGNVFGGYVV